MSKLTVSCTIEQTESPKHKIVQDCTIGFTITLTL